MTHPARLTPFGVIDKYLNDERCTGWPSFHAERIMERLTAEGYAVAPRELHVLQLRARVGSVDEIGWTSLHHTRPGAERKLVEQIDEWGLRAAYEMCERGLDTDFTYSISTLPIED